MKKFYILLVAMALTAGTAFAQSNDSIERARQQEALMRQQQKEQQELLQQQQKEQERLQKEQQREQEKALKEQQKAEQKAAKAEEDRVKREQEKAEQKARAEQKKAEKKRKQQERYASWGRQPRVTADPYATILTDRRIYTKNNQFNSVGINLGIDMMYRRPIARRWDFNIGLGYRQTMFYYSHLRGAGTDFNGTEENRNLSSIMVPIRLSHFNKDNRQAWYIGVTPGIIINKTIAFSSPDYNFKFNRYRLDVSLGNQDKWLIFAPGTEIYFNILPTYATGDGNMIHEFGIRLTL